MERQNISNERKKIVKEVKEKFLVGSRIRLLKMDDIQAPKKGTEGTVKGVDDLGSILVGWDNGSSLSVIYGVDLVEKISWITLKA